MLMAGNSLLWQRANHYMIDENHCVSCVLLTSCAHTWSCIVLVLCEFVPNSTTYVQHVCMP